MNFFVYGKVWSVKVLSPKRYDKMHGKHEQACCLPTEKQIHLREGFSEEDVTHELVHAYFSGLCIESANLSPAQFEEIACDLFSRHGEEIIRQSKAVVKRFS